MSDEVKVEGLENIAEMLEEAVSDGNFMAGLQKACALVEGAARVKAQALGGNGDLARSIASRTENLGELVGVVFTPLFYAPYVEYGTGLFAENGEGRSEVPWVYVEGSGNEGKKGNKTVYPTEADAYAAAAYLQSKGLDAVVTYGQHPHPFLRPALNENKDEVKRLLKGGKKND